MALTFGLRTIHDKKEENETLILDSRKYIHVEYKVEYWKIILITYSFCFFYIYSNWGHYIMLPKL